MGVNLNEANFFYAYAFEERLSLKIGQVKKWPSPIIKFHSNFESPSQSEYAGKFSDQSDDTSHFYRTRKVDDGFFG